ncbi:MAG: hypothetical protein II719_05340 [Clostridia bacterium]|nr:hypothetical protein [Clostridia bacterium]
MKRKALLVACLLIAASAVSCGESAPEGEPSPTEPLSSGEESAPQTEPGTEPATAEPDWKNQIVYTVYPEPEFPDLDLTGKTFRVSGGGTMMKSDGLTGEIINDTVYARNLQVEERFGITLDFVPSESADGNLKAIVAAGQPDFDMVYGEGDRMWSQVSLGYALDFCDLPFVDFTEGFWFPNLLERFSCYGRIFLAPSDICPNLGGTVVTFFNKRILTENDLESPYQMVYDNRWTLDNFLAMIRSVSRDVNGDGIMDENDQFGIGTHNSDSVGTFIHLLFGTGMRITAPNEDGSLSFAMDGEKVQALIDRTSEVLRDGSVAIDLPAYFRRIGEDDRLQDVSLFENGHELFLLTLLNNMQTGFREMEDDFGVAPVPKYDSEQTQYYHRAQVLSWFFAVPTTCGDLEKTGAVFTYMTWLSNQTVLPAYYEVTLKQKRTRDEDSAKMLDLIRNSINFDFGDLFTRIRFYLVNAYDTGSYERIVGSTLKKLTKDLNKLQDKLKNLD